MSGADGAASRGPVVRTDIVEVFVYRRSPRLSYELLQLRRASGTMAGTWQPVLGHVLAGESALGCAARELREETGLGPGVLLASHALERVHPFYLPAQDAVVMSPRFAVEAPLGWEPTLNAEHDAHRWVHQGRAGLAFVWPSQIAAWGEIEQHVLSPASRARPLLEVEWPGGG